MTPAPQKPTDPADEKKPRVRTHTPRPDELTRETFEFITSVDEYKRKHMRSFLNDGEVLDILAGLGYEKPEGDEPLEERLEEFAMERARYRKEQGRLFPTWSEVFKLLMGLGYQRRERDTAA